MNRTVDGSEDRRWVLRKDVDGADGRHWRLRSTVSWTTPAGEEDFEHDLSAGRRSGMFLTALLVLLVAVLVAWRPSSVVVPGWLVLLIVIAVLVPPARWLANRPWTIVAETAGRVSRGEYAQQPAETWKATVWGTWTAWQTFRKVGRTIPDSSAPDASGPLKRIH
jgi:hypothetical protein